MGTFRDLLLASARSPAMLRTLFASHAFLAAQDSKFDRPVEFVAQIVRALNPQPSITADKGDSDVAGINLLGQLPFYWSPPDGYPDLAGHWATTSGFLNRWRIALFAVTSGQFNLKPLAASATTVNGVVDALAGSVLRRRLGDDDRQTLVTWIAGLLATTPDATLSSSAVDSILPAAVAMLVSSAYFQLR